MNRRCLLVACALVVLVSSAFGGTLYHTEFEEFNAGNNQWAGTGGWVSNDSSSGAQGIIQDPVADLPLGRAAYLGYEKPLSAFTTVFRTINHDPESSGLPLIEFESLLGVQDSTNGRRDRFHISFYNIDGGFLAAVTFDNTTGTVRRDDGVNLGETGVTFLRGEPLLGLAALQVLGVHVDLANNVWTARLDGVPLFTNIQFTATGKARTLGAVAVEWELAAGSPAEAGNNWLLVADWLVGAVPRNPFELISFTRTSGASTLTWQGHAGFNYTVLATNDLKTWSAALPNSSFPDLPDDAVVQFTDSSPGNPQRFYRVERSLSR